MTTTTTTKPSSGITSSSFKSSLTFWDHPYLNGLGGLKHGSLFFFGIEEKGPKTKEHDNNNNDNNGKPQTLSQTFYKILTLQYFLYSPNLSWFIMATIIYQYFPYNPIQLNSDGNVENNNNNATLSVLDFTIQRLVLNHVVAFLYIGFWHMTLYVWHYPKAKPFVSQRKYKLSKVLHNMFYTWLGILHWTITEIAFVIVWSSYHTVTTTTSGMMMNQQDNMTIDTNTHIIGICITLLVAMYIPSYRDIQFYFVHRLIHLRYWLYKYIHGVHHRNTDTEPFSGLAMHPIEHLYYFSCYGPILIVFMFMDGKQQEQQQELSTLLSWIYIKAIPYWYYWMGFHTALSPAASHSGYDGHFNSDLIHYLHHRYYECNYGAGINFDLLFGTYQNTFRNENKETNVYVNNNDDGTMQTSKEQDTTMTTTSTTPKAPLDPKATLDHWWNPEHVQYQLGLLVLFSGSVMAFCHNILSPIITSIIISIGPILWSFLLASITCPATLSWHKLCLAPFDKDPYWSQTLHFGLGFSLGVLPVTYLLYKVLVVLVSI